ncbi:GNAT family N-acetyltransferase [Pseudoalteromonas sp. SS15]|uniref:GNAT family N-acetyltransferase n=1 Tax=Pseudoalteromonas sp. SS15 TaxID=3139393 RepID=UPI003BAB9914
MLNGKKIYLRRLSENDASPSYLSWFKQKEINNYIKKSPRTIADLKSFIKASNSQQGCHLFGIFDHSHFHIGNIKLDPISYMENTVALGIMIGESCYRGKGIAFEAMELAFRFVFDEHDIETVILGVNKGNIRAVYLYEKFGFKSFFNPEDKNPNSLTMKYTIPESNN